MLSGSLDDFTLPEVLRMLATLKKSGTLNVTRRAGSGRIEFRDGDVVYAETELSKSLLGQKLVRGGKITDVQLRRSLDVQATTGDRLGHILLVSGAVTKEDVQSAVRAQVEDAAYELICWEAGEFLWEKGDAEESDADISLNVDELIRVVAGRLEQKEEVRRRIQSPSAVPRLAVRPPEGAGAINITPDQWRVLVLVDGATSVSDIAERAGATVAEAGRSLYQLAAAGLIDVDEADPERTSDTSPSTQAPPPASTQPLPIESGVPEEWFEDPVQAATSVELASEEPPAPAAAADVEEPEVAFPVASESLPAVGRAAAVRELSGLFDDPRRSARGARRAEDRVPGSRISEDQLDDASEDPAPPGKTPPPPPPKGIISRLARRGPSA